MYFSTREGGEDERSDKDEGGGTEKGKEKRSHNQSEIMAGGKKNKPPEKDRA